MFSFSLNYWTYIKRKNAKVYAMKKNQNYPNPHSKIKIIKSQSAMQVGKLPFES